MGIPVKLEAFEGPLDLLLHLIDKNKINIYDIPIVLITEQYMAYINKMQEQKLDIMSEFLVMAATLLNIKSKMLLPKSKKEQEEEEDPRKELMEKLLEYKLYKYMSYKLKDKQMDASRVLYRNSSIPEEIKNYKEKPDLEQILSELTLARLSTVFQSVMKRQMEKTDPVRSKFGNITKEEISIETVMENILIYAKNHKIFSFRNLLEKQCSKICIIVTFLGVLELMKSGEIKISQKSSFEDIEIVYWNRSVENGNESNRGEN